MNKYNFVINSFGLQFVKPKLYQAGEPLPHKNSLQNLEGLNIPYQYDRLNSGMEDNTVTSALGTPVFAEVTLSDNVESSEIQLIWVICTVSIQKNIVKTSIQGRNGTVKEYINMGDYNISLQGGLFDANPSRYPYEHANTLIKLCKLGESLKVTSDYLQLFDITNIVVESANFTQVTGRQNVQLFNIQAISDNPIQLLANE